MSHRKRTERDVMRKAIVFLRTAQEDKAINFFDSIIPTLSPIIATNLLNLLLEYLDYSQSIKVFTKFTTIHKDAKSEATYSKLIRKVCESSSLDDRYTFFPKTVYILEKMISLGITPRTRSISPIISKIVELDVRKSRVFTIQDLYYLLNMSKRFDLIPTKEDFAYLIGFAIRSKERIKGSKRLLFHLLTKIKKTYHEIDNNFTKNVSSIVGGSSGNSTKVGQFAKDMNMIYLNRKQRRFLLSNIEDEINKKHKGKQGLKILQKYLQNSLSGEIKLFDVVIDGGNIGLYGGNIHLKYNRIANCFSNLVNSKNISKENILIVLNSRHKSFETRIISSIKKILNIETTSFIPHIYWSPRGVNDDLYILYSAIFNCNYPNKPKLTKIISNDKFQDHQYNAGAPLFFKRWINDCVVDHNYGEVGIFKSYSRCIQFIIQDTKMDIYFPIEDSSDILRISTKIVSSS